MDAEANSDEIGEGRLLAFERRLKVAADLNKFFNH